MQWKQLDHFVTVARYGSFSRAARECYIAQSSLSQSVLTLERELGFLLFKRSRDGVRLTDMGQVVYRDAGELLDRVDGLTQRWKSVYEQRLSLQGHLSIGVVPGSHPILMNRVIRPLKEDHPKLSFKVLEARDGLLPELLAQGTVDLILGVFMEREREEMERFACARAIELVELRKDAYKIALSAGHPLAAKEDLSAEDIKELSLACFFGGDRMAAQFFGMGFDPVRSVEYTSFDKMIWAAREGTCVSVLPELSVRNSLPLLGIGREDLRFLTVEGISVPFCHFAARRSSPERGGELELILQRLKQVFAEELT